METKFTPGPWSVGIGSGTFILADRVPAIASVMGPDHEANARLIAAAPELLEILARFSGYTQCVLKQFTNGRGYLDMTGFHSLIDAANATVAKATGD